uniref:hypothetical protein n=1 Tax=Pedobacter schmidteae TaxID=2201271 RepID=UPI000EAF67FB|nr:hypothetical protein [Pedobacter schmidteae]
MNACQPKYKAILSTITIFLLLVSLLSCQPKDNNGASTYGLITYDSVANKAYFTGINSFMEPKELTRGAEININGFILAQKENRYYVMDNEQKLFVSYLAGASGFKMDKVIPLKDIPWEPYMSWVNQVDAHTILIGTVNKRKFSYIEIDLDAMKIKRHGGLAIPATNEENNYAGVSAQLVKDKLFVSYTFQKGMMREHIVPCNDTLFVAQFSYPDLQLQSTTSDKRTTWPGSYTILAPNSLVYENNIYVLGQPGGRTGNHKTAASSVLKLDAKNNSFDPDYDFEIANPKNEEAYTLHDIGHGLAITSVVPTARIKNFMNYMVNRVAHYVLLDLEHQKKIPLNLPEVHLDWIFNTIWEDDLAYISVYQKDGSSQFWQYNHKDGSLKKGARIKGTVIRINKLKP